MSLKVAVACEDHTFDQYIARPIVKALLNSCGKPKARVAVISDPKISGISVLLDNVDSILTKYGPIVDFVLFAVDIDCRDGANGRQDRLRSVLDRISGAPHYRDKALVVGAVQELEVWALWGSRSELPDWANVRAECHPKEAYFEPLLLPADGRLPDGGRTRLVAASLSSGLASLIAGCPELGVLRDLLRAAI